VGEDQAVRAVLLAAVLLLHVPAAIAQAQLPQQQIQSPSRNYLGFGIAYAQYPLYTLLQREPVQKELKLTQAQKARIAQAQAEFDKHGPVRNQEHQQKRQAAAQAGASEQELHLLDASYTAESLTLLDGLLMKPLDKSQRVRLGQLRIQVEGPMALLRPEVQERLNLDPAQVALIRGVITTGREELIAVSALPDKLAEQGSSFRSPEQVRELNKSKDYQAEVAKSKQAALKSRASTMQKIRKLLTKGQRARYESLAGPPFDVLQSPKK
jgi:hypothetical protein